MAGAGSATRGNVGWFKRAKTKKSKAGTSMKTQKKRSYGGTYSRLSGGKKTKYG